MKRVNLCDMANESNHFGLNAEISGNRLTLVGEYTHLDEADVKKTGSSEYYYFLDEANTNKFFEKMNSAKDDLEALKERFHGIKASQNFREFCTANHIKYAFYSIA